jgi:hypothetical protein
MVTVKNRDLQATWKYHDGTKHSYRSIRTSPHYLDWANRPLPFKIYPKIEPFSLPRDLRQTGVSVLSAISGTVPSLGVESVPGVEDLARLLYFSAGITKQRAYSGGEIYFRAAACTGALYEIELYVVSGDLPGLEAGVYHFNPADVSLRLLRKGDFRGNLAQATAMEPAVAHAPATIICTGTYWRNAWKYPGAHLSRIRPGCYLNGCWGMPITSDSTRNKPGRKARRWGTSPGLHSPGVISAAFNLDHMLGN